MLLREAAKVYGWKLNYSGIAFMWRGGCIIRRCVCVCVCVWCVCVRDEGGEGGRKGRREGGREGGVREGEPKW